MASMSAPRCAPSRPSASRASLRAPSRRIAPPAPRRATAAAATPSASDPVDNEAYTCLVRLTAAVTAGVAHAARSRDAAAAAHKRRG
eukprot:359602-Chlamydomonas_euryale.AAC.15